MGATLYYQATSVYFGAGKMDVDNEIVEEGEGTAMEHHWDEAFGYLGVPIDFPSNTDGVFFWGDYLNDRNEVLDLNQDLMDAFLLGRAAISNKDLETRDEQIDIAREKWELAVAGTAIHYLNSAATNFDDYATRCHALSEAAAFIFSLTFNEEKAINNSTINELLFELANSGTMLLWDFSNTTSSDIISVRDNLANALNLSDKAEQL